MNKRIIISRFGAAALLVATLHSQPVLAQPAGGGGGRRMQGGGINYAPQPAFYTVNNKLTAASIWPEK